MNSVLVRGLTDVKCVMEMAPRVRVWWEILPNSGINLVSLLDACRFNVKTVQESCSAQVSL